MICSKINVILGINTARDIFKIASSFTRLTACEIKYNNFEISLVVFMPNITTNHAITYTNDHQSRSLFYRTIKSHLTMTYPETPTKFKYVYKESFRKHHWKVLGTPHCIVFRVELLHTFCGFIITCTKSNVNIQLSHVKARG